MWNILAREFLDEISFYARDKEWIFLVVSIFGGSLVSMELKRIWE